MKATILFFLLITVSLNLLAQNFSSTDPNYIKFVQLGNKALEAEKYDSCLVYYKDAFAIKQTSTLSTLRMAACAFSAGKTKLYEVQLAKAFEIDWGASRSLFNSYPEFQYLQNTPFSKDVNARYQQMAIAAGLDVALMEEFDQIMITDQAQRGEMRGMSEKYGRQSPQMDSLWKLQNFSDSVNTIRISQLIDEKGYPGKSMVGPGHQSTAFLVIQHADLAVQEKYLPIIKEAADAGEIRWSSVALLIDRVRQRQGKKQIYGSQVNQDPETDEYFFGPIEEPYKVDSIRNSVGLGPLSNYAQNWNFAYDPDKHVARHSKDK